MGFYNVEKWDWKYALLKHFVNFNYRSYYKSIHVTGKENIPKNKPVIFAPNHQNALMDALAILYTTKGQPVFTARSDIFKKSIIKKVLTFLKLIPIYRIRDGYGNLKLNDEIIRKITDILSQNHSMVIFPEGNHGERRKLRALKKGICRMAFQAEEAYNYKLDIQIVPVGLDYTNYYKFNHHLLVNFGKPISVQDYISLYKENPSKAHLSIINNLSEELKKIMLHIENSSYYNLIDELREIFKYRMKVYFQLPNLKHPTKFKADKKFIQICENAIEKYPEEAEAANNSLTSYLNYRKKLKFKEWVFQRKPFAWWKLILQLPIIIILFPVFIYGFINHLLPAFLPVYFSRKMKDYQFWSSVRSTMTLVTFPLFYLLQFFIVWLSTSTIQYALIYLITLPLTGIIAYHYSVWAKKLWAKFRFNWLKKTNNKLLQQTISLRNKIIEIADNWFIREGFQINNRKSTS
jgi:1-acyl-sn-glycerol-3-phosphate acyltransferase